jgi:hypothetical protein
MTTQTASPAIRLDALTGAEAERVGVEELPRRTPRRGRRLSTSPQLPLRQVERLESGAVKRRRSVAMHGWGLVFASVLFWVSWVCMPGVGVTDAREIFALVGADRGWVAASVVLQLVSAALYAPALVDLVSSGAGSRRGVRTGAALLLVGAMASAADAMLHLLAYAMTGPGLDERTLIAVMGFMQGPGLVLLAPLLLAFFAGGAVLSAALARAGVVPRWNPRLHALASAVAAVGGLAASLDVVPARLVGLATLGLVSAAQAGIGLALRSSQPS